ncbi:MAG: polysaccharide biosynthesis tyrosine autokinase [Balneolales bacterium]
MRDYSENHNGNSKPDREINESYSFQPLGFDEMMLVIYRGKWLILTVFVVILAATVWYTDEIIPEYESESTIIIEASRQNENILEARQQNKDKDGIGIEVAILGTSIELAERVAKRLIDEGIRNTEVYSDTIPLLKKQLQETGNISVSELSRRLPEHITVIQEEEDVNMLKIQAVSTDPREAAMIANFYVQEYMIYDQSESRKRLSAAGEYLKQLETERGASLKEHEQRIQNFLNQDHVMVMEQGGQRVAEDINRLYQEIEQDELRLQMMSRQIDLLEEERDGIIKMLNSKTGSGTVMRFEALKTALAEYEIQAERYYMENPMLRANPESNPDLEIIVKQIEVLEKRLGELAQEYSTEVLEEQTLDHASLGNHLFELRREIRRAQNERLEIVESIEFKKSQIQNNESNLTEILNQSKMLEEMQRDKRIAEQLYTTLLERVQQNQIAERAELGRIRLVTQAYIPSSPVRPNKMQNYIVGSLFGLLAGIGLVFLRKSVDNKINDPQDMRRRNYNVIGVIPDMTKHIKISGKNRRKRRHGDRLVDPRLVTLVNAKSGISEAYRRLRINIEFGLNKERIRTITVSSSKPGEGKSVNAMNLALSFAQSGKKVLLVDADLRKPTAHTLLGLSREPGLSDLLLRNIKFKMELFETGIENFYFLPCGRKVSNPPELLGSDQMISFIKSTAEFFDIVIYDTPPLQVVTDASMIAGECDATIIVARANDTEINLLDLTRQDLNGIGIKVSGTILNRFDYSRSNVKGYSYKYKYKNSYKELYAESES